MTDSHSVLKGELVVMYGAVVVSQPIVAAVVAAIVAGGVAAAVVLGNGLVTPR